MSNSPHSDKLQDAERRNQRERAHHEIVEALLRVDRDEWNDLIRVAKDEAARKHVAADRE